MSNALLLAVYALDVTKFHGADEPATLRARCEAALHTQCPHLPTVAHSIRLSSMLGAGWPPRAARVWARRCEAHLRHGQALEVTCQHGLLSSCGLQSEAAVLEAIGLTDFAQARPSPLPLSPWPPALHPPLASPRLAGLYSRRRLAQQGHGAPRQARRLTLRTHLHLALHPRPSPSDAEQALGRLDLLEALQLRQDLLDAARAGMPPASRPGPPPPHPPSTCTPLILATQLALPSPRHVTLLHTRLFTPATSHPPLHTRNATPATSHPPGGRLRDCPRRALLLLGVLRPRRRNSAAGTAASSSAFPAASPLTTPWASWRAFAAGTPRSGAPHEPTAAARRVVTPLGGKLAIEGCTSIALRLPLGCPLAALRLPLGCPRLPPPSREHPSPGGDGAAP